jgi:hypothetical protein
MWGTSKKGTIPLNLLDASAASSSAGGMFSGDEKVIDHPMRLNLNEGALQSFLTDDGSDGKDEVALDKIFCGASGTSVVLDDGRCFVMGSNKNGELG